MLRILDTNFLADYLHGQKDAVETLDKIAGIAKSLGAIIITRDKDFAKTGAKAEAW